MSADQLPLSMVTSYQEATPAARVTMLLMLGGVPELSAHHLASQPTGDLQALCGFLQKPLGDHHRREMLRRLSIKEVAGHLTGNDHVQAAHVISAIEDALTHPNGQLPNSVAELMARRASLS